MTDLGLAPLVLDIPLMWAALGREREVGRGARVIDSCVWVVTVMPFEIVPVAECVDFVLIVGLRTKGDVEVLDERRAIWRCAWCKRPDASCTFGGQDVHDTGNDGKDICKEGRNNENDEHSRLASTDRRRRNSHATMFQAPREFRHARAVVTGSWGATIISHQVLQRVSSCLYHSCHCGHGLSEATPRPSEETLEKKPVMDEDCTSVVTRGLLNDHAAARENRDTRTTGRVVMVQGKTHILDVKQIVAGFKS